jgi:UDP-glucose 4-epimerase
MKSALVTGGAGFIGSHLVDRLLSMDYSVTVIDNLSKGNLDNLTYLKTPMGSGTLRFYERDLTSVSHLTYLLRGQDAVFHLAATQDFRNSLKDHFIDFENNVRGTLNLLEAVEKAGVPDFVFSQTTALYGENDGSLMPENYVGVQTNLYGASKLAAGGFAEAFTQLGKMRLWTFRFGRVLGAKEKKGAIWDFVGKLKADRTRLEILGNGKQSRQYIHVEDIVDGIMFGYAQSHDKVNIFNLSTEELVTTDQLTDIVLDTLKLKDVVRSYTSDQPRGYIGDNPKVHLDTRKIRSLGWEPRRTAREAIAENTVWAAEQQDFRISG